MKKNCFAWVCLLWLFGQMAEAFAAEGHPCIYVSADGLPAVRQKVEEEPWAREAFATLRAKVETYADRHAEDPQWIVSRLAMYWKDGERYTQCYLKNQNWDRGEGNAPVPTVRMPGMRTWNRYANVPLEDRIPYNETGDMLGVDRKDPSARPVLVPYKESGHMVRSNNVEILTLAEEAAFVHWVTGEEKFARFAADIFNTWLAGTYYMKPILDPGKSCGSAGGWKPGGICGYYDYEQIHDDLATHAAVVYDFLYDYLAAHPHPHFKEKGMAMPDVAEEVFKRFIDIGMVRGGKSGNWNVNGWNMMFRPVLVLRGNDAYPDKKGRDYYLNHLVHESTEYHDAIPDMLASYDAVTGLWPESPGYAFGTVQMLLEWTVLLQRRGVDVLAGNPVLEKAAMGAFPWMDEAGNMVVFGDSRGGAASCRMFENLLAYYARSGQPEKARRVASVLRKAMASGKYDRSEAGWAGICTYVADLPEEAGGMEDERMSYSPFHRFITMKNWNAPYKMMACLYGGRKGSHLTPNGLALQLYGFGYALAPDAAAYESYWSKDYAYHQSVTGVNTIVPGYTEGEIAVRAMEPEVGSGDFTNREALTDFLNFADVEAGEKRRTVAMVRVSGQAGYYVDFFRSGLEENDYLFHHVGTGMSLADSTGAELACVELDTIEKPRTAGYAFFSHVGKVAYGGDFTASWMLPEGISARLWMAGVEGRELFRMEGPSTTLNKGLTPGDAGMSPRPTPVLLVRQEGRDAFSSPFVGVYEAYKGQPVVERVANLAPAGGDFAGVEVVTGKNIRDFVFCAADNETVHSVGDVAFRGTLGFVRQQDGVVEALYLGKGRRLSTGGLSIMAGEEVYAALFQKDGKWYYSSTGEVKVGLNGKTVALPVGYSLPVGL